jgi:hypothetical protein
MDQEFREQIYNELDLRETEDLLEIWHANDHEEWSDVAFDVVKEILIKRLGEIPPQEVVAEQIEDNSEFEDDGIPEWEAKLLDNDNQPEYYDTLDVLELRDSINKTAKAVIVIYGLSGLVSFTYFKFFVNPFFQGSMEYTLVINLIAFILACLTAAITIAITYYPLKALTDILRILMEMEFNSRK